MSKVIICILGIIALLGIITFSLTIGDMRTVLPSPAPPLPVCVIVDGKADLRCTYGVTNPFVTPATITTTICASNWTASIRPATAYTTPLKIRQMKAYGLTGGVNEYREDHLLPLSLGGASHDSRNLWPQPVVVSRIKDQDTAGLKRKVCAGTLSLAEAQIQILQRWTHCPVVTCPVR